MTQKGPGIERCLALLLYAFVKIAMKPDLKWVWPVKDRSSTTAPGVALDLRVSSRRRIYPQVIVYA